MSRLVVVGSGGAPYRRYAMEALADRYRLGLVLTAPPTWQTAYADAVEVVPPGDAAAVVRAVRRLAEPVGEELGLLTWDELVVEECAAAAATLGLPAMSPDATALCRDKLATRRRLADAGLGSARFRHVHDVAGARAAAAALGYPVVVKPRSLAGSAGVVLAADDDELVAAVAEVLGARYSTLPVRAGVLVEELLVGPEVSVDVATADGRGHVLQVTRKEVGFPPHFEEVAHVVRDYAGTDWYGPATQLALAANAALGVRTGITHTEIRLTARGPAVVEVNARLAGDLIPYVGRVAGGVDQVLVAAEVALGGTPGAPSPATGVARVEFVYPPHDAVLRRLATSAAAATPGVVDVIALAEPGDALRLPPRAVLGRVAALVVTGGSEEECAGVARTARARLAVDLEPLGVPVAAAAS